jgi:hypothetical protein
MPTGLGATELLEFIKAVLPQEGGVPETVEPQPKKKAGKKKSGFAGKSEPEVPTLETIASRAVSPEEIAAVKEGKSEEGAVPLIQLSDTELAKLRPDLLTLEEQDYEAALVEQKANHLNVVSTPAPADTDELEDL